MQNSLPLKKKRWGYNTVTRVVERFEDMSPRGRLRLLQQTDGDIIVCIVEDPNGPNDGAVVDVEFCTSGNGGGGSPHTLLALRQLMDAMRLDNIENHKPSRRGELGLDDDTVR